jgi:hypothetical protein
MTMRMMMKMWSSEKLLEKWIELGQHSNGYIRIDSDHQLEWSIGHENITQKSLLLITPFEPKDLISSKSILVSVAQRADNRWALTFRLIRDLQEAVYIRLCLDLIESSRNQDNTLQGLEYVLDRYSQWSRLLEHQRSGILSEAEIKGLLGEITFLQQLISQGVHPMNAVNSWIGPEKADQDFVDANGWYEIKAPGIGSKTISISSLEQLDAVLPGEIILFFIDKTAPNDSNGFTLLQKVANLRYVLRMNQPALESVNRKLSQYGFMDMTEYDKQWYRLSGQRRYRVDENFPRLIRENIQSQIADVNYQINIQGIEGWRIY